MNNWVFIRGLARHSLHWGPFPEVFRAHFPEAKIEMLDIRGNGTQSHIPSFTSVDENVRDLRSRSQFLKEDRVNLLTISLGSMIGIQWATLFPDDVASLTCTNTSDGKNSKLWERLMPRNFGKISEILLGHQDALTVEENIMKMIAPTFKNGEKWAKEFSKVPPTSHQNLLRQLLAAGSFHLPARPACPVLLLASKGDQFVNPVCSERIGKAWGIDVRWHLTAGHDLQLEFPDWVCDELLALLENAH